MISNKVNRLLLVTALCFSFTACSSNENEEATEQPSTLVTETPTEAATAAATIAAAGTNFVVNGDFESADTLDPWVITNEGTDEVAWYDRSSDATSGTGSLHFYSDNEVNFTAEQEITGLDSGIYDLSCSFQGDGASDPEIYIYAIIDGTIYKQETTLNGYLEWDTPTINDLTIDDGTVTIGISVKNGPGGWGTIDDFSLVKQ